MKKLFLKISESSQENTFVEVSFLETPTQVFSCKDCKIFKNTYFEKYLRTAASTVAWIWLNVRKKLLNLGTHESSELFEC